MQKASIITLWVFFLSLGSWSDVKTSSIAPGEQPQICSDTKSNIRVVFGLKDKIFCSTSNEPALVAQVPDMHLGMSRGPQLASSANYSIITAMDKSGSIHCFRLSHLSNEWKNMGTINDLKGSSLRV